MFIVDLFQPRPRLEVDNLFTAASEAVAKMVEGADVLVHEAMYVPAIETYIRGGIAKGRPIKFED
jgi:hypothetical protein